MEITYGDYEASKKEVDAIDLKQGNLYFLFQGKEYEGWPFTFAGLSEDGTKRGAFEVGTKPKYKDLKDALKKNKTKDINDISSLDLLFQRWEDGEIVREIRLGYNVSNGKWGKNPMSPYTFREPYLTPQGKQNIGKQKIGKFKDFLDI